MGHKQYCIHIIGISRERKINGTKTIYEEMITDNFPKVNKLTQRFRKLRELPVKNAKENHISAHKSNC